MKYVCKHISFGYGKLSLIVFSKSIISIHTNNEESIFKLMHETAEARLVREINETANDEDNKMFQL